ncbi:hypothetical protein A0O21_05880 [Streptococcus pantholopis]|uniref:Uncharacterized protein n=1 Tax=Streptococcus pantholopis TaxID=1811193 RepID=A0A172Q7Z8_9STRE|nr:hypothetical protein A0O21_05880 [Streptococcus pantholopis]
MSCITMTTIFFTRILGRVQFIKIQRPFKEQSKNGGKPEIFDFVGAPLPERLERCGRPQDDKAFRRLRLAVSPKSLISQTHPCQNG